jgi:hypothetical protein
VQKGGTENVRDNQDCVHPKQPDYSSLWALLTQELVWDRGFSVALQSIVSRKPSASRPVLAWSPNVIAHDIKKKEETET